MPGKVNPVIPEATLMVCAQVIGNDAAITFAGASGNFELNVMLPVIARNILESIRLLANASALLAGCVDGITADRERMRRYAESSPSVVTPLNKYVGYEHAAKIAKQALADGKTIRETVIALGFVERGDLTEAQLDEALDVERMTTREHDRRRGAVRRQYLTEDHLETRRRCGTPPPTAATPTPRRSTRSSPSGRSGSSRSVPAPARSPPASRPHCPASASPPSTSRRASSS